MQRKHLLLAMSLGSFGIANAQTTTNTYSSTSTTSTYATSPTTTDSTNATNNSGTMNTMNSNTTNNTNATDGTTTTYSTNSAATPAYGTTTTTTTNGSYNTTDPNYTTTTTTTTRPKEDRAWGKEGKFGIYAGVNFSRFVNEPIPDGAYRAGWQAGLYGRSGGTVFGQLGLEYRNSTSNLVRNNSAATTPTVREVRGQIDQHFIAIPAYVGLRIGGALGLRIQAGLELSTFFAVGNNNFNIGKDDLNRVILGGLGGVGINLGPLTLDAVYNVGLQNVFQNADTKRQILAFNLGLRF